MLEKYVHVIADQITYEDWLSGRFGRHTEWIQGAVIQMSPVTDQHSDLNQFLEILLLTLVRRTGGGRVFRDPMVMRAKPELPARQPDLQVILPERYAIIESQQVAGPAHLVVEIVSRGSSGVDRGDKFDEYETGGVNEYWIIDPIRKDAHFYVLGEDGLFHAHLPEGNIYHAQVLPQLKLHIDWLWQITFPDPEAIIELVKAMLNEGTTSA
jgi:Uma2 family endonuclease